MSSGRWLLGAVIGLSLAAGLAACASVTPGPVEVKTIKLEARAGRAFVFRYQDQDADSYLLKRTIMLGIDRNGWFTDNRNIIEPPIVLGFSPNSWDLKCQVTAQGRVSISLYGNEWSEIGQFPVFVVDDTKVASTGTMSKADYERLAYPVNDDFLYPIAFAVTRDAKNDLIIKSVDTGTDVSITVRGHYRCADGRVADHEFPVVFKLQENGKLAGTLETWVEKRFANGTSRLSYLTKSFGGSWLVRDNTIQIKVDREAALPEVVLPELNGLRCVIVR